MDLLSEIALDLVKSVDVPGVEDKRLLADCVGAYPKGETNMGIVEIVGRGDAHIMDGSFAVHAAEFFYMAIESLELGEEIRLGEVAVEDADGVALVQGRDEAVARVLDGFKMARGEVAGYADQGEVLHFKAGYRRWGELGFASLFSIPIVIFRMFPVRVRSAISLGLRSEGGSHGIFETDNARHRQRAKKETLNGGRHAAARQIAKLRKFRSSLPS